MLGVFSIGSELIRDIVLQIGDGGLKDDPSFFFLKQMVSF